MHGFIFARLNNVNKVPAGNDPGRGETPGLPPLYPPIFRCPLSSPPPPSSRVAQWSSDRDKKSRVIQSRGVTPPFIPRVGQLGWGVLGSGWLFFRLLINYFFFIYCYLLVCFFFFCICRWALSRWPPSPPRVSWRAGHTAGRWGSQAGEDGSPSARSARSRRWCCGAFIFCR